MRRAALLLLLLAGCGGAGGGAGVNPPSGKHVLFLNFEGQTLDQGADDPVLGKSALVGTSTTFPPYLMTDVGRTTKIRSILAQVQTILAPYDVLVTTSRPAAAGYDMIVAGGPATAVGLTMGTLGTAPQDCATPTPLPPHVSLVFDDASNQQDAARQIVASLGVSHSVPRSTASGDCMCIASGCPTGTTSACAIGSANTPQDQTAMCKTNTTMNEAQLFLTVFGPHP